MEMDLAVRFKADPKLCHAVRTPTIDCSLRNESHQSVRQGRLEQLHDFPTYLFIITHMLHVWYIC